MDKLIALFFYFWLYFTITILFAIIIGVILTRDCKQKKWYSNQSSNVYKVFL